MLKKFLQTSVITLALTIPASAHPDGQFMITDDNKVSGRPLASLSVVAVCKPRAAPDDRLEARICVEWAGNSNDQNTTTYKFSKYIQANKNIQDLKVYNYPNEGMRTAEIDDIIKFTFYSFDAEGKPIHSCSLESTLTSSSLSMPVVSYIDRLIPIGILINSDGTCKNIEKP
jgi:hypothetical protein